MKNQKKRYLTRKELRAELFGILAMCNGFLDVGIVGGRKQEEMKKVLPKQIAIRIMDLMDEIDNSVLEGISLKSKF